MMGKFGYVNRKKRLNKNASQENQHSFYDARR